MCNYMFGVDDGVQMEVLDEDEWWGKMEGMKSKRDQEMVIHHNLSRGYQQTPADMAQQLGFYL